VADEADGDDAGSVELGGAGGSDDESLSESDASIAASEAVEPAPSILKRLARLSGSASVSRTDTPARSRPATATSEAKAQEVAAPAAVSSKKRKPGRPAGAPAAKRTARTPTTPSRPISGRKAAAAAKKELKAGSKRQAAVRAREKLSALTQKRRLTPKQRVEKPAKKTPGKRGRPATKKELGGPVWEVEAILEDGIDGDTLEHKYFVKWKGYDDADNTWEPKYNLTGSQDLLDAYEKQKKQANKGKRTRKAKA